MACQSSSRELAQAALSELDKSLQAFELAKEHPTSGRGLVSRILYVCPCFPTALIQPILRRLLARAQATQNASRTRPAFETPSQQPFDSINVKILRTIAGVPRIHQASASATYADDFSSSGATSDVASSRNDQDLAGQAGMSWSSLMAEIGVDNGCV